MTTRWHTLLLGVSGVVALGTLPGCQDTTRSAANRYFLHYELSLTGAATMDSVRYDDGSGAFVKVLAPPSGWQVLTSALAPGSVEVRGWGTGATGSIVTLREQWSHVTGSGSAWDSATVVTTAPGVFSLSVMRHTY